MGSYMCIISPAVLRFWRFNCRVEQNCSLGMALRGKFPESPQDVSAFLRHYGFSPYEKAFLELKLDLSSVTESTMIQLGMSRQERDRFKKILLTCEISRLQLNSEESNQARQLSPSSNPSSRRSSVTTRSEPGLQESYDFKFIIVGDVCKPFHSLFSMPQETHFSVDVPQRCSAHLFPELPSRCP